MKKFLAYLCLLGGCLSKPCIEEAFVSFCDEEVAVQCRNGQEERQRCSAGCDDNFGFCTVCGDGFLSPGEECDDGDQDNTDACLPDCTFGLAVCGDGFLSPGELCDDGNNVRGDGCESDCTHCGDNVVDEGERCDPGTIFGTTLNNNGCHGDCQGVEACGDGVINPGDICYLQQQRIPLGEDPITIVTEDFNRDGEKDLAVVDLALSSVSILTGDGTGSFVFLQSFALGSFPRDLVSADFNGDTFLDLVVFNGGDASLSLLLGNGDGAFEDQQLIATGVTLFTVQTADLNQDGAQDIISSSLQDKNVSVMLGAGDGTFTTRVFPLGFSGSQLALDDFNGDDTLDLAVTTQAQNTDGALLLLFGDGDGGFGAPQSIPAGLLQSLGVVAADFNNDGAPDLVASNFFFGGVSVLLGDGLGGFGPGTPFSSNITEASATPLGAIPAGARPYKDMRAVDVDQDSNLDLVAPLPGGDLVDILFGDGTGRLTLRGFSRTGDNPLFLLADDFNGDGAVDLITPNFDSQDLSVILSNP